MQLKLQHSVPAEQVAPVAGQALVLVAQVFVDASRTFEQQSAPVPQMSPSWWHVGGEMIGPNASLRNQKIAAVRVVFDARPFAPLFSK